MTVNGSVGRTHMVSAIHHVRPLVLPANSIADRDTTTYHCTAAALQTSSRFVAAVIAADGCRSIWLTSAFQDKNVESHTEMLHPKQWG